MITIKNKLAANKMATAGQKLSSIFNKISEIIVPGISTLDIDTWIASKLKESDLVSKTKGYMGYRHVSCISVNEEIVHGVPNSSKILARGDLVKIDVCAAWKGYCADMARCFFVGGSATDLNIQKMVDVAQSALNKGIQKAVAGNNLTDISAAIQDEISASGYDFGIVRDFAGHGIGKEMHEEPEILNYGKPGRGPILRVGMAFALEPMITMGSPKVVILKDGWTAATRDKSWAAHVEDTVFITEDGPKILTRDKEN